MKNIFRLCLLICILQSCKALEDFKNQEYYNGNGEKISRRKFNRSINYSRNIDVFIHEDGIRKNYLKERDILSQLTDSTFLQDFSKSTGITIDHRDLYIGYFKPSQDDIDNDCLDYYYQRILRFMQKAKNHHVLIILHPDYQFPLSNKIDPEGKLIFVDKHKVLDQYFFEMGGICDFWLTVQNKNYVHIFLGEGGFGIFGDDSGINIFKPSPKETLQSLYFDEAGNKMTGLEFRTKLNTDIYIDKAYQTDSAFMNILVRRIRFGKLKYALFQHKLNASLEATLDYSRPMAIHYFEPIVGEQMSLGYYLSDRKMKKLNKKYSDVNQIIILSQDFVNAEEFLKIGLDLGLSIYQDKEGFLETNISKYDVVPDHWISILPDGRYRMYLGEGGIEENVQRASEGW